MSKHWKPPEYSSVSPYLMVRNAQGVIDFLKQVLGAIELRRFDMPDGTLMHGEVRIDDSVIMLAEGSEAHPAFTAWLHVYVRDVDATYRRALEQGAESVQEPRQREGDPDRRGGVKDPAENVWWISTQMEP